MRRLRVRSESGVDTSASEAEAEAEADGEGDLSASDIDDDAGFMSDQFESADGDVAEGQSANVIEDEEVAADTVAAVEAQIAENEGEAEGEGEGAGAQADDANSSSADANGGGYDSQLDESRYSQTDEDEDDTVPTTAVLQEDDGFAEPQLAPGPGVGIGGSGGQFPLSSATPAAPSMSARRFSSQATPHSDMKHAHSSPGAVSVRTHGSGRTSHTSATAATAATAATVATTSTVATMMPEPSQISFLQKPQHTSQLFWMFLFAGYTLWGMYVYRVALGLLLGIALAYVSVRKSCKIVCRRRYVRVCVTASRYRAEALANRVFEIFGRLDRWFCGLFATLRSVSLAIFQHARDLIHAARAMFGEQVKAYIHGIAAVFLIVLMLITGIGGIVIWSNLVVGEVISAGRSLVDLPPSVVSQLTTHFNNSDVLGPLASMTEAVADFVPEGAGEHAAYVQSQLSSGDLGDLGDLSLELNFTQLVDVGLAWFDSRWPNETAVFKELWRIYREFNETTGINVTQHSGNVSGFSFATFAPQGSAENSVGSDGVVATSVAPAATTEPPATSYAASPSSIPILNDGTASCSVTSDGVTEACAGAAGTSAADGEAAEGSSTACDFPAFYALRDKSGEPLDWSSLGLHALYHVATRPHLLSPSCWPSFATALGASSSSSSTAGAGAAQYSSSFEDWLPSFNASSGSFFGTSNDSFWNALPPLSNMTMFLWSLASGNGTSAAGAASSSAYSSSGANGTFAGDSAMFQALRNATASLSNAFALLPSFGDLMHTSSAVVAFMSRSATLLVSYAVSASASVVSFILSVMIFLSCLYYLLASERDWLSLVLSFLPDNERARVQDVLSRTVRQVFIVNAKVLLYHALFTFLLLRLLDVHFVYTCVAASAVGAVLPFLPSFVHILPALLEILLLRQNILLAIVVLLAHTLVLSFADWYMAESSASVHPAVLGLSIIAGMSAFGLQGALVGPILVSVLLAFYILATEMLRRARQQINPTGFFSPFGHAHHPSLEQALEQMQMMATRGGGGGASLGVGGLAQVDENNDEEDDDARNDENVGQEDHGDGANDGRSVAGLSDAGQRDRDAVADESPAAVNRTVQMALMTQQKQKMVQNHSFQGGSGLLFSQRKMMNQRPTAATPLMFPSSVSDAGSAGLRTPELLQQAFSSPLEPQTQRKMHMQLQQQLRHQQAQHQHQQQYQQQYQQQQYYGTPSAVTVDDRELEWPPSGASGLSGVASIGGRFPATASRAATGAAALQAPTTVRKRPNGTGTGTGTGTPAETSAARTVTKAPLRKLVLATPSQQ
jgi:predicted PurR-regulated permease PerM